jgi:uncharacterized protein DUF5403
MAVIIYPECNSIVAHLPGVKQALASEARRGANRARGRLARHKLPPPAGYSQGHSFIDVTQGTIDSFVGLNDTRGDHAAGAIEALLGILNGAW